MSKNYTNYSKMTMPETVTAVEKAEGLEEVEEAKEVTEEIMEQPAETVEEIAESIAEAAEPKTVIGTVTSPKPKLNVRSQPSPIGKVLGVIDNGSKVKIDLENSAIEWYKVSSESGLEGYCMKQFVEVK